MTCTNFIEKPNTKYNRNAHIFFELLYGGKEEERTGKEEERFGFESKILQVVFLRSFLFFFNN